MDPGMANIGVRGIHESNGQSAAGISHQWVML